MRCVNKLLNRRLHTIEASRRRPFGAPVARFHLPRLSRGAWVLLPVILSLTAVTTTAGATAVAPAVKELAAKDPDVAAAVETFTQYIARVRAGDDDGARVFWHPEDRLPVYDWAV
jgi:hypothetical protein